jgi:dihydrofolate reductase
MISIIAAISENNAIGKDNKLLWHLPEDLRRFKELTTGKVIVMGQKTFESLPIKPLPNRTSLVITDDRKFKHEGVVKSYSIETAVKRAKKLAKKGEEIFIIGGGSIYKQFMEIADKLYITEVKLSFEDADTFFPSINKKKWNLTFDSGLQHRPDIEYRFKEYDRK